MFRLFLLRFFETYFRHRWLWLLPVVAIIGIGVASIFLSKPTYVSDAAFYVNKESLLSSLTSVRENGFSVVTPAKGTVDELQELFKTDAFIRAVIQKSDLEVNMDKGPKEVEETLDEVRDAIWVDDLGNNTVTIGAAHEDPVIAQQLAQATIDVFLQWKINAGREQSDAALTFIQNLVDEYQKETEAAEKELKSYLEAHPEPVRGSRPPLETIEINRLQNNLTNAMDRTRQALDDLENTQLTSAVNESNIRQIYLLFDAPRVPTEPARSLRSIARDLIIFTLIGILVTIVGLITASFIDRTFRFKEDVEQKLGLPVIASLPMQPKVRSEIAETNA